MMDKKQGTVVSGKEIGGFLKPIATNAPNSPQMLSGLPKQRNHSLCSLCTECKEEKKGDMIRMNKEEIRELFQNALGEMLLMYDEAIENKEMINARVDVQIAFSLSSLREERVMLLKQGGELK